MNRKNSLMNALSHFFKTVSGAISNVIDKLLYSQRYLTLVSLAITLLIFASVLYSDSLANQITQSTELKTKVEIVGDLEEYEISQVPEEVDALISGSSVDVRSAINQNNYRAVLDVSNLGEGTHRVRLDRKGFSQSLKVIFQPETLEVNISKKISAEFEVEPSYINTNKLESQYIISDLTLENKTVTINTSQEKLNQISEVRALVDVGAKTESFESLAKVVAYDQNGLAMDVEIIPVEIGANVTISSPNRKVPIVVSAQGVIPNNKAIDNITLDQPSVTIYGSQEVLNKVNSIPAVINATTLTQDKTTLKHTLIRPDGVRSMELETINMEITLAEKTTREIEKSQIFFENNTNNYDVSMADGSDMVVDVILEGTLNRLNAIDSSQIKVYIDMSSLKVGNQSITLKVSGPDPLVSYKLKNNPINIVISEKGE